MKNKVTALCYDKTAETPRSKQMPEATNKRVRINLSESSKGLIQWDITAEFESVEETKAALSAAVDAAREVIAQKGLKEVSV